MPCSASTGSSLSTSLLERLRLRDETAWQRFVDLYGPTVYGWCRRSSLPPADAADVTQEVLFAVSRAIGTFERDNGGSFHGWVATITRNKTCDYFRRRSSQTVSPGGTTHQEALQNLAADETCLLPEHTPTAELGGLLARATEFVRAEFEPRTWDAFWMTAVLERDPSDVAQALEVSVNAVYKARSRVLKRLREELDGLL